MTVTLVWLRRSVAQKTIQCIDLRIAGIIVSSYFLLPLSLCLPLPPASISLPPSSTILPLLPFIYLLPLP